MKRNLVYSIIIVFINTLYPLIVFPYISRVLSVEGIGTYNYYNLLFSYLSIVANFGISLYASKEIGKLKDEIEKRNKLTLDLIIVNIANFLIIYALFIIPLWIDAPNNDKIVILLFSIMLLSNALSSEWFFVAIENQKFILIRNVLVKCTLLPLIFILVKNKNDLNIYITIVVLGLFVNALINFSAIIKEMNIKKNLLCECLKSVLLKNYYKGLLSIFMVECSFRYFGMIDIAIIEKFESREKIGFLTFALSIYNIVSSFLKIIATTLLPRASYYISNDNIDRFYSLTKDSISLIFLIGLPASFLIFFGAEPIVLMFGGVQYYPSINILKGFSFLIILTSFINILVFQILYPLNKNKSIILCYIAAIAINIISLLIFMPRISLFSIILSSFLAHIVLIILFFIRERETINYKLFSTDIIKYIIASIIASIVILLFNRIVIPFDKFKLLSLFVGFISYLLIISVLRDKILYNFLLRIKRNAN